ncbi:MAG: hypothetical protein JW940_18730 [Polyangiaceae bacterium]|nr:hypothetical protein [Polyangiaceae bacterium]
MVRLTRLCCLALVAGVVAGCSLGGDDEPPETGVTTLPYDVLTSRSTVPSHTIQETVEVDAGQETVEVQPSQSATDTVVSTCGELNTGYKYCTFTLSDGQAIVCPRIKQSEVREFEARQFASRVEVPAGCRVKKP